MDAKALKIAKDKHVLNEFDSKILNEERVSQVFQSRKTGRFSTHVIMAFHCECDDPGCSESIRMSTEEYQHVHTQTRHFVVIPEHVRLDIEEIITSFNNYVLVGKFFPHPAAK